MRGLATFLLLLIMVSPSYASFDAPVSYPVGPGPEDLVAVDIDGDGDSDLAVAVQWSNTVTILVNNGAGEYTIESNLPTGTRPLCVYPADLDGDGDYDLATANYDSNNMSILINNGDGTFRPVVHYPAQKESGDVVGGDFDSDGDVDLAVSNRYAGTVSVFMNIGDGTFLSPIHYRVAVELHGWPHEIRCADLNKDGHLDLATVNLTAGDLSILFNNGDGSFAPAVKYPLGSYPSHLEFYDMDNDDDLDILILLGGSDKLLLFTNNGVGSFVITNEYSFAEGCFPNDLIAYGFDDNRMDFAVTGSRTGLLYLLSYTGSGFTEENIVPVGLAPNGVITGDLNSDGSPDLAVANTGSDDISVLLSKKEIQFVSVDIKPGSCPNPLNLNFVAHGQTEVVTADNMAAKADPGVKSPKPVLPVAILGTEDFDVTNIDPESVVLEGAPAIRWSMEDVSTPLGDDAAMCECTEAGPDGFIDLTLKFYRIDIINALGEVHDGDIVPLTLAGELYDGTSIEGVDCVVIVGNTAERSLESNETVPDGFSTACFPNPFNPATEIRFALPEASHVTIDIYNVMGQKVTTLVDEHRDAGRHTVRWDGSYAASGVYFYRIEAGSFVESRKMILLK